MFPVLPVKVKVVLLVPVQTVAAPEIVPATYLGLTVTETNKVVAGSQAPLDTNTL